MTFVQSSEELMTNAYYFSDALRDGRFDRETAQRLLQAGRVYLPFRQGDKLAFAPAKFIGYAENSITEYTDNVYERNGGRARAAVSRVLGYDARADQGLELQLENFCLQFGLSLHNHKHSFWLTPEAKKLSRVDRSAIYDLDVDGLGNDDPEYRKRMAGSYARVQKVRNEVLRRAAGKCEFCGGIPFVGRKGAPFLEAHHVISLSEQGPDKPSNVIALCPNHHREAHFGERWAALQDEFLKVIASKIGS